jgi:hypothetical protein
LWCHVRPGRRVVSIYARQSQLNIRNHKSRNADRGGERHRRVTGYGSYAQRSELEAAVTDALLAEQLVIVGVRPNPEPNKAVGYLCGERAMASTDAC